jgi:hypothetical protein
MTGTRILAAVAFAILLSVGCSKESSKGQAAKKSVGQADAKKAHDHGGWWCDEHGIPEHLCALCDARLAKQFKGQGDWCEQHDRPMSQCFKCNPKQQEYFAQMYREKYGKEPPPVTEQDESQSPRR